MLRTDIPAQAERNFCNETVVEAKNPCLPTRRQRLAGERDYLRGRLAKLDAAIAALDSSPQLAELVELIESA